VLDRIDVTALRDHNSSNAHNLLDGLVQNIEVFVGNSLADCKVWDD
jgi:hypothetical protein